MDRRQTLGWKLDPSDRARLLARFPPRYVDAVADHVTFKPDDAERPALRSARLVGRADDREGVEAMVVELNGSTDRPDGSTWHITWSLGPARRAVESNDVIKRRGWAALDEPVDVTLTPAAWP
jgi:hypothetical protein